MDITWYGHSAFMLDDGLKVLIDPFLDDNPRCPIPSDEVNPEVIAITHGHGDHIGNAPSIARRTGANIITIHELANYFKDKGIESKGLNKGGTITLDERKFRLTHALHSSGIEDSQGSIYGGDPCGFIIDMEYTVYHAGDTCLFTDMKWMGDMYDPEIAILPIGDRYTMDTEQAVMAVKWIKPELAIPMHFGTFPVLESDASKFKQLVEEKTETRVMVLNPGDTKEIII